MLHHHFNRPRLMASERLPSIYEPSPGIPPYRVMLDCPITRRKVHSLVLDSRGKISFRSRLSSDVVEWLANEGETAYTIVTANGQFRALVEPKSESEE